MQKLSYYVQIAISYVLCTKKIKYLGSTIYYDNPATPLNLQNYPYEIKSKVLANMLKKPKTVLDIGGNLGQFSLTINHMLKSDVVIDIFEPNSYVFELLKKNISTKKNMHIYNYGLGDSNAKKVLHFNPRRTGIGSLIKQNAGDDANLQQIVCITHDPHEITNRKKYDLVKVDVEGYELHAIRGLAGISCDYLFIELSGQTRKKDYFHSEMMALLSKQWGEYDVYYSGGFDSREDESFDVLIRFK